MSRALIEVEGDLKMPGKRLGTGTLVQIYLSIYPPGSYCAHAISQHPFLQSGSASLRGKEFAPEQGYCSIHELWDLGHKKPWTDKIGPVLADLFHISLSLLLYRGVITWRTTISFSRRAESGHTHRGKPPNNRL